MRNFRQALLAKRNERGSAELVTTLMLMPLLIFVILALIEVSVYMQTRTSVQNALADATRQVAAYGGDNTRLNPTANTPISAQLTNTLFRNGRCTYSHCENGKQPTVRCGIVTSTGANGIPVFSGTGYATSPGQEVACYVTYPYKGVTGGGWLLGFEQIAKPFSIVEYSRTEVGFR